MTDSKALIERLREQAWTITHMEAADHIEVLETHNEGYKLALAEQLQIRQQLEADNVRLRAALEGLKAAVDGLDNPFDASASGEMHYGFERAVDDATLVIEAAL